MRSCAQSAPHAKWCAPVPGKSLVCEVFLPGNRSVALCPHLHCSSRVSRTSDRQHMFITPSDFPSQRASRDTALAASAVWPGCETEPVLRTSRPFCDRPSSSKMKNAVCLSTVGCVPCVRPCNMSHQPSKGRQLGENLVTVTPVVRVLLEDRCSDLILCVFDSFFAMAHAAVRIPEHIPRNLLHLSRPDYSILQRNLCWLSFFFRMYTPKLHLCKTSQTNLNMFSVTSFGPSIAATNQCCGSP